MNIHKFKRLYLGLILFASFVTLCSAQQKEISSQPGQTSISKANLAAGAYNIIFRLKINKEQQSVTPLATLTVSSPEYPNILYKSITPIRFVSVNTTTKFQFLFDNFKTQDITASVNFMNNKVPVPELSVEKITIAPVDNLCVATVWPGKILYYRHENASGFVIVYNGTRQYKTIILKCFLESGIDNVKPLKTQKLTLEPRERMQVPVKWNTGNKEYGFALVGSIYNLKGKKLSENKQYFSVADNLWKVGMYLRGRGTEVPFGVGANQSMPVKWVKEQEKALSSELAKPFAPVYWNYGNYVEFYAWSPDDFFNLSPDTDYWYSGTGNYTIGKKWLQLSIKWLHRRGMRAISYLNPFSCGYGGNKVLQKHPDWFVYDKNGQVTTGGSYYEKKLEVGEENGPKQPWYLQLSPYALTLSPDISTMAPIKAQVEQIIKSQKMFGWDGVRFDNEVYGSSGYDFYGHKIAENPKQASQMEIKAWEYMKNSLWKKLGHKFVIGDNFDYYARHQQPPGVWEETCKDGQLLMCEMPRGSYDPQSPWNKWSDFLSYFNNVGNIVDRLGGYPLIIGFDNQYPVDHLYLNIFTYAARLHPYCYQYHPDDLPFGNYAQFVTRYSALIWDIHRIKPLSTDKIIEVKSNKPIWWKGLAYVRLSSNGKSRYIINLINPPVRKKIYTDPTNSVPFPIDNIQVILKEKPGEKISNAYLLSAEPVTHMKKLPVTSGNGYVSVTIPKIYFWSMVVFE
ncbi:MAG: hypothetical protein M1501_04190 [Candidatus Omnitrophica bacterium]|nr:hypothetical protein [Candidatus Omnitrophota bacterium]